MYRSYCLTVRPRDGLLTDTQEELRKWCCKQDYAVMAIEEEGAAKHAHCQVWYREGRARGDMCKAMQRICERTIPTFDAAEKKVLRQGVKIAYDDWHINYLQEAEKKEDNEINICVDNPPERTLEFYPTEEEQQAVQDKKRAVDQTYHDLACKFHGWYDGSGHIDIELIANFLSDAEFGTKTIHVMKDHMTRLNKARNLFYYITGGAPRSEYVSKDEEAKFTQFEELAKSYKAD